MTSPAYQHWPRTRAESSSWRSSAEASFFVLFHWQHLPFVLLITILRALASALVVLTPIYFHQRSPRERRAAQEAALRATAACRASRSPSSPSSVGSVPPITPDEFVLDNNLLEDGFQAVLKEVTQLLFDPDITEQQGRASPVPQQPHSPRRSVSRVVTQANAVAAVVASPAQPAAVRSAASLSRGPASGWTQRPVADASPWNSRYMGRS